MSTYQEAVYDKVMRSPTRPRERPFKPPCWPLLLSTRKPAERSLEVFVIGKPATILEAYDLGLSVFRSGKGRRSRCQSGRLPGRPPCAKEVAKWQRQPKTSVSCSIAMGPVSGVRGDRYRLTRGRGLGATGTSQRRHGSKTRKGCTGSIAGRPSSTHRPSWPAGRDMWLVDGTHLRIPMFVATQWLYIGPGSEAPGRGRYERSAHGRPPTSRPVPGITPPGFGRGWAWSRPGGLQAFA